MVFPGELVTHLSEVLHVAEPTVRTVNRVLAETKPPMLTKGARGVNAVHRTPLDTARILIALLGTNAPTRAPEVVRDFGTLEWECRPDRQPKPDKLTLAELCGAEFDGPHTFENALAALIGGFGRKEFRDILEANMWDSGAGLYYPFIGVKVRESKVDAEINVDGNAYYYKHRDLLIGTNMIGGAFAQENVDAMERYLAVCQKYGGILTERSLTMNEIRPIAEFVCAPPKLSIVRKDD